MSEPTTELTTEPAPVAAIYIPRDLAARLAEIGRHVDLKRDERLAALDPAERQTIREFLMQISPVDQPTTTPSQ